MDNRVWVVVSDCGLNGPWVHGVFTNEPTKAEMQVFATKARPTTGYQNTAAVQCELDREIS